jgi:hypothetical protein
MTSPVLSNCKNKRATDASVKAEFFKAVYRGCLDHLEPADIASIFARGQSETKSTLTPHVLLQTIWHEKGSIPLDLFLLFLNNLENVLSNKGLRPDQFMFDTVVKTNHGAMVSPASVLVFFAPYITKILKMNIRELLLDTIVPLNALILSGTRTVIVKKDTRGNYLEYVLVTHIPSACGKKINGANWLKPLFQSLGVGFGFPAIEEVSVLAETLSIAELKDAGKIDEKGFCEFNEFAKSVKFSDILVKHNVSVPPDFHYKNTEVKVCAKTLKDKKTGSEIAVDGCAYGAPFHMFKIRAFKKYNRSKFSMVKFISSAMGPDASVNARFEYRHGQTLTFFEEAAEFSFSENPARLFLNGRMVSGGVPARILFIIITSFLNHGQQEFSRADFAHDTKVIKNKLDKSFNLYLKRALLHVQSNIPFLTITRQTGTGKIFLHATGKYRIKKVLTKQSI